MTSASTFLNSIKIAIKSRFDLVVEESMKRDAPLKTDKNLAVALLVISFLMLSLAATGYLVSGYHWGFASINSTGEYLSPVFLHNLTLFGDGLFLVSAVMLIANRNIPLLYCALIAAIIGGLVSQSLKRYFNAERPPAVLDAETFHLVGKAYFSRSFPSGHTLTAFLVATVLACFSQRRITQAALILTALGVGFSRVWLGVHWFIDILVGGALGIICGLIAYSVARRTVSKLPKAVIVFTIILFALTALSTLIEPNDYAYAQPLIFIIAILALWRTIKNYLMPSFYQSWVFTKERSLLPVFFAVLVVVTCYRLLVILQPHLSLFYDEAYYYHWSLTPDLGYYSKPPVVAWLISLGTLVAGHTVFGVKLSAALLYSLSGYIIYLTGKKVASTKAGVIAGLVYLSAPVVGFNSVFITTDAPLIFFWSLSLYLFVSAIESATFWRWLALGIAVGLGMLSKYTMAALPLSLFIYLLVDKKQRTLLARYQPWLAAIVAGLIFSLNLWWNSQHDWISFAHTSEISQQDTASINVAGFLEFLAGQTFVLGPVWAWLAIRLVWRRKRLSSELKPEFSYTSKVFLFATLGILIIISLQALSSRAFINWAAPWIVGCSLLIGVYASSVRISGYLRAGLITHLLLLSAFYHWPQLLNQLQIEPSRKNNPYQRLAGWDALAQKIQPFLEEQPNAILASDSRDILAYVGFHALPKSSRFARWNPDNSNIRDHYDLKYNFRQYSDSEQQFLFISKAPLSPQQLSRFDSAYSLGSVEQKIFKDKQHKVFVYRLKGFNGYE